MEDILFEKACPACRGKYPYCKGCNHRGAVMTSFASRLIGFLSQYFDIIPKGERVEGDDLTRALSRMIVKEPKNATLSQLIGSFLPNRGSQDTIGRGPLIPPERMVELLDGQIQKLEERGFTVTPELITEAYKAANIPVEG